MVWVLVRTVLIFVQVADRPQRMCERVKLELGGAQLII